MKKRTISRMLTTMLSSAMIAAQMAVPISAMAADEDTVDVVCEEETSEDVDTEEVEADFVEIEMEDAAEYVESDESELVGVTVDDLVPPINVKWLAPGRYSFDINSDQEMFYGTEVYCDGVKCGGAHIGDISSYYGKYSYTSENPWNFKKSGVYVLKAYVAMDDSSDAKRVYSPEVAEISWTCPEQRISDPTNLHWEKKDDKSFAIITCDPVDHASYYSFDLYQEGKEISSVYSYENSWDFSEDIGDVSEHEYYVVAYSFSDDLTLYNNGAGRPESPKLSLDGVIVNTQKDIVELGKDTDASNVEQKVQQVKDLDKDTLKTSLQTSNEALAAMANIEDTYVKTKGIEILPATSDIERIATDNIEMTGAALNVSQGTIQLSVKDQKENGSGVINTDIYTNIIAFDMSVKSSEGVDFSKELEVPVTISMPIPEGMDTAKLVILHYRADGTEELIHPRIENGKAVFAITHFSTFALAEKKEESGDASLGNTFSIAEAEAGVKVMDGNHTLKLELNSEGHFSAAKILDSNGTVDTNVNSFIANIVAKYAADGTPEEFYSLIFRNGVWDPTYDTVKDGLYTYLGEQYSIAGGVVNLNVNSLTYTGDIDGWKYIILGHVVKDHAGLVAYGPADDLHWFWIDKWGNCDTEYSAIVDWNGGRFLVHGGRLRTDYTGFTYDPQYTTAWYHITNGQVWGDGEITDISIEGGTITRNVESGRVVYSQENIVFGSYEQDGDLSNGPEPIEWDCLAVDDKGMLLISRYVLDIQQGDMYEVSGTDYGLTRWANDFYDTAFSDVEKSRINVTSQNPVFYLKLEDIMHLYKIDRVVDQPDDLLSHRMGTKTIYSQALIAEPTAYAEMQGVHTGTITQESYENSFKDVGYEADVIGCKGACWRIPGDAAFYVAGRSKLYVSSSGIIDTYMGTFAPEGVRPALYLLY